MSNRNGSDVLVEQLPPPPHLLSSPTLQSITSPAATTDSDPSSTNSELQASPTQNDLLDQSRQDAGSVDLPAELPAEQRLSEPHTSQQHEEGRLEPGAPVTDTIGPVVLQEAGMPGAQVVPEQSPVELDTTEAAPVAGTIGTSETAATTEPPSTAEVEGDTNRRPSTPQQPIDAADADRPAPVESDSTPSWVLFEEDYSTPDEEEMKEIEASEDDKFSTTDIPAIEAYLFSEVDDPEYRPCKKLRMNWVIKGIRGTKERPNLARVMNSPAVCMDGMYWSIKFYPRGDNSTSLSAFVRCSRAAPSVTEEMPEFTFKFFEGAADADFTNCPPSVQISAPNTQKSKEEKKAKKTGQTMAAEAKKTPSNDNNELAATADNHQGSAQVVEAAESTAEDPARAATPQNDQENNEDNEEDDDDGDGDEESVTPDEVEDKSLEDWRISAQLGMAIYNPAEPRTGYFQSDGHQFSRHCDDWGWVTFVGPWADIHKRKRGQRQPLLRDDTLAIDAYVRIYDDPTQALWWHDSKTETQWPSKQLAGYFPFGTPQLYHSSAVSGMTAWLLLAPFRELIQETDGGQWRYDSTVSPRPLLCQSQVVMHQMRHLTSDCYVNLIRIVEELLDADEPWEDVNSFWEVYRRGLEIDLQNEPVALKKLSAIFDADGKLFAAPSIPVPGSTSVMLGVSKYFTDADFKGALPNFLPVVLNRQHFDKDRREWKLHHDRVILSDELDLQTWSTDTESSYTLYGFVVHVDGRSSGKFYTILRPGGIGTKWLAFEDGNGNKVLSYTKKRIEEFEGLEGDKLKDFEGSRENACMALYIRSNLFKQYAAGDLEPYKLPRWMRKYGDKPGEAESNQDDQQDTEEKESQEKVGIKVELYLDELVERQENVTELHDLRSSHIGRQYSQALTIATDKSYADLRTAIGKAFEIEDHSHVALYLLDYDTLAQHSKATLEPVRLSSLLVQDVSAATILRIWISITPTAGVQKSYKDSLVKITKMTLDQKAPVEESIAQAHSEITSQKNKKSSDTHLASEQQSDGLHTDSHEDNQPSTPSASSPPVTGANVVTAATELPNDATPNQQQVSIQEAVPQDASQMADSAADGSSVVETVSVPLTEENTVPENVGTQRPQPIGTGSFHVAVTVPDPVEPDVSAERTVEHGHLADAVQHAEFTSTLAIVEVEPSAEDGSAQNDTNPPVTVVTATDQEPGSQLLALPSTPRIHGYGLLFLFDALNQKLIPQRFLLPEIHEDVLTHVRKHLSLPSDTGLKIWKREGRTGLAPVQESTIFASAGLTDAFTLVAGYVLSDSQITNLKAAGQFWQPAQLIRYLNMSKRGHPILSKTFTEPIEIFECGGDYYKGTIVNGQFHGDKCVRITSYGHTYEGPLVAGQMCGTEGKMTYQNGDVYTGGWENDERHGQGELVEASTGNRYVGGFQNGKKWGEGVTYWKVADEQAAMCQICYCEEIDALFYECGHVCACVECAKQCDSCPICRRNVQAVVKMFRA